MPGKKMFGSMDKTVVAERQAAFETFLDLLQECRIALWQLETLKFLNIDDSQGIAFKGWCLNFFFSLLISNGFSTHLLPLSPPPESFEMDAMMVMRGLSDYSSPLMLSRIGSRSAKGFILVSSGKSGHLVSLVGSHSPSSWTFLTIIITITICSLWALPEIRLHGDRRALCRMT